MPKEPETTANIVPQVKIPIDKSVEPSDVKNEDGFFSVTKPEKEDARVDKTFERDQEWPYAIKSK